MTDHDNWEKLTAPADPVPQELQKFILHPPGHLAVYPDPRIKVMGEPHKDGSVEVTAELNGDQRLCPACGLILPTYHHDPCPRCDYMS